MTCGRTGERELFGESEGGGESGCRGGGVGVGEERESGPVVGVGVVVSGGRVGVRDLDELREGDDDDFLGAVLACFRVFLYSLCFMLFSFRFKSFFVCFACVACSFFFWFCLALK